jgi:hypothetical protein
MKLIALVFILGGNLTAALAQQPPPARVYFSAPSPFITYELAKACPATVVVLETADTSQYHITVNFSPIGLSSWAATLFDVNKAEAVAAFRTHTRRNMARDICSYFEAPIGYKPVPKKGGRKGK